ncbi:TonB-dependent receptor [Aquimarina addita]|uniref:TonB-dependent receptor n=1 Tax=Aquimarina addita TaxID=870485 RepID=A0ABP6UHN1_9FLAO
MKIKYFLMAVFLSTVIYAQEIQITGKVTDVNGQELPGVNVIVKGTSNGAVTDFDGFYTLSNISNGAIVTFSYLGFITLEKTVVEDTVLNIVLEESSESLEQVVVIGYGMQKTKNLTGSVSVLDSETIDDLRPIQVEQALQGTVTGVNVDAPSGSPGENLNITIRGISSNGSNQPLVVIDGYYGELNSINPNDVESITILKDSQAAIYGIEGANGVVLVTTKKGRKNKKTSFSYDAYTGFQQTTKKLSLLNATEYGALLNESYAANGQELLFSDLSQLGEGTDWQESVFETAPIISHNMSFSGGSDRITYFVSGSHLEQAGIVTKEISNFKRNTAKIRLGVDLSDKFDFDTTINYFHRKRRNTNNGEDEYGLGTLLFNAINYAPTFTEDQEDVNGFLGNEVINPLSQTRNTYNRYTENGLEGMGRLDYKPVDGLKITTRIGFRTLNADYKTFSPIVDYGAGKVFNTIRSSVTEGRVKSDEYTFELFGTYNKVFAENHDITITTGFSLNESFYSELTATGFDVPNNSWEFADISLADGLNTSKATSKYSLNDKLIGQFARLEYNFDERYLFSALLRRDAASDFITDNRVDYFPSITAGWNVSEEAFWSDTAFVNYFKLRGSYGLLGNRVGGNLYRALLDGEATYVLDGQIVDGVANGRISNRNASWEVAKKIDIGTDVKFLDSKISIIADFFIEDREDLLISDFPVSGITGVGAPGAGAPTVGAGTTRNTGYEFLISYNDKISKDFSFGVSYNVSYIENEVVKITGDNFVEGGVFGVGQLAPSRMEVGKPIGYFYGLQTDGVFQNQAEVDAHPSQLQLGAEASPGDIRYVDTNNDGIIDFDDRTDIGKPQPDLYMGFNLNFKYKQFDFVAYSYANLGQEMVRNYERDQPNVNRLDLYLDRWTGEGTSNTVPRATTGTSTNKLFSDFFVEDASFLRIQNVQLGYSLPENVLESVGINKLRIYVSGNNLYTFTDYNGFDPAATTGDAIGGGIDYGFYPISRQYLLGVNLNF